MGRRGPRPTPDTLKAARGNPGKKRLASAAASKTRRPAKATKTSAIEPPRWLVGEGLAEWRRLVSLLEELGILHQVDQAILAACCDAWARYMAARGRLKKVGPLVKPDNAAPYTHPLVTQLRDARADWLKMAREVGLTPSARTVLNIEMGDRAEGGLAEFLKRRPG